MRQSRIGAGFRRMRSERGVELIEFAISLPVLLFVLTAILDFGFLFQRYEVVTNAAREGARLKSNAGASTTADVQARLSEYTASPPWLRERCRGIMTARRVLGQRKSRSRSA